MRKLIGKVLLGASRWSMEGEMPSAKKFVLIAAPHTSNWDFLYAMAYISAKGLPVRWMGKNALFRGPQGALMRALGGIPVDRTKKSNMVQAMVEEFERHEAFVLLVPAEGTRSLGERWKSGFYHIARGAGVPIALGYLDYRSKRAGIGPLLWPTTDVTADMDRIRDFYADKFGKYPKDFTPPRLREEDDSRGASGRLRLA
jgi:1-acyl-sn-glycerol-3-phosphate acyltransferase